MLSVSETTISPPATVGPDYPESGGTGARHLAAPLVVLAAVALLVVGIANVQVARERSGVERDLATARVAAARVPDHLAAGDGEAVAADLALLSRAADGARSGSAGLSWLVAGRADLNGAQVRAVRRDSRRAAALAEAGAPLSVALAPLTSTAVHPAGVRWTTDPNGVGMLGALDELARGLNRYATAARSGADPSAPDLERAAVAAGLLPTLAGAEGPRSWTVCRAAAGPCTRTTVSAAAAGSPVPVAPPGTATPPGRHWVAGVDLLVVGIEPRVLFPRVGSWNAAAAFDVLYHLDAGTGVPPITVRSAVGPEQLAIDQLSRHSR